MNFKAVTCSIAATTAAVVLAGCSIFAEPEAPSSEPKAAASSTPAPTPSEPASTPSSPETADSMPSNTPDVVPDLKTLDLKLLAAQTKREMGVPVRLDANTVLTNVDAQNGMLLYRYTLNDVDGLNITSESLKARIAPQACANPETRQILRKGTDMSYMYDVDGVVKRYFAYSFIVSERDCA